MNSGFITQMKDKNGDSWYHQIVVETQQQEIERLNNIIKEVREYIENNWINQKDADIHRFDTEELEIEISDIAVLYDLLDKGE